jgi:hypothetical protein
MMDESDMDKQDPKRFGLESDIFLLDYIKNALKTQYELFPTRLDEDYSKLMVEKTPYKKAVLSYLVEQKKYLTKLIEQYQYEMKKLIKEDSL